MAKKQKIKNQILPAIKWIGGIGGILTFLAMLYNFGVKYGEDVKNIEIVRIENEFNLKELDYKHQIFRLELKCDSLQKTIKDYEKNH